MRSSAVDMEGDLRRGWAGARAVGLSLVKRGSRSAHLSPRAAGRLHMKRGINAAALSYPSPLWGGWPAEGWSGGGSHNRGLARGYPHPGLRFWTMLRIVQARPTLPTKGRD